MCVCVYVYVCVCVSVNDMRQRLGSKDRVDNKRTKEARTE